MKGVTFDALGEQHTLAFTTNALCAFEDLSGVDVTSLNGKMSVRVIRALIAAGLGVAEKEAGAIIDDIGFAKAGDIVEQAMTKAFPETGEAGKLKASQ